MLCRTFSSVDGRQFLSPLLDIFHVLNPARKNVRHCWSPLLGLFHLKSYGGGCPRPLKNCTGGGLDNFPIPGVGSLVFFWRFRWGWYGRNPPPPKYFVGWSNITSPNPYLYGFYPYLHVKVGVGEQKVQVGGIRSHFVDSSGGGGGGGMKKLQFRVWVPPKNWKSRWG